ncbi:hypothetical protein F5884DRAFT_245066 [Xylogone sp. PMI_703]|nr:hypothetical protein F5884DRAFT_245066 [Xylogone sp. PMI_703]
MMRQRKKILKRQRDARSRPGTKTELQFVNVISGSQHSKAETRTIIRANAAHFHWRHNRPPQDASQSIEPAQDVQSLVDTRLDCRVADAFWSYASKLPKDLISRCIDYNIQVILPALFPDGAANPGIRDSLLQLSLSYTPLFQMFVMGGLINLHRIHDLYPGSSMALDVTRVRAEIVRHMSVVMRDPVEACKDVNILAVSALANKNLLKRTIDLPTKLPNQGPLKSLQFINLAGMTECVPIHANGLSHLIELKGGLEKIETPGVAALVSLGELITATRNLVPPSYPVFTLSYPPAEFRFKYRCFGFGDDPDLYEVLSMLNSYTMMVDDFCEGRNIVTASTLIDHRNTAQHALISLPPRTGCAECYRLSALIYSLLVTFPLPYTVAPFRPLVRQLKAALSWWDGNDEMLTWVLVIGGMGAVGLEEREWFVKTFHLLMTKTNIRSWEEVREVVKKGLWYGPTNDADGRDFWYECQNLNLT